MEIGKKTSNKCLPSTQLIPCNTLTSEIVDQGMLPVNGIWISSATFKGSIKASSSYIEAIKITITRPSYSGPTPIISPKISYIATMPKAL